MKRISTLTFVVAGLAVAVVLMLVLAPYASTKPDGLEKVAADHGIDAGVTDHALAGGTFADYGVRGVGNAYLAMWVAGLLGVAVTFLVCAGLVALVRRRRVAPAD